MAAACELGALCAGAGPARRALYARFGGYVGMVAQLANDLAALAPEATGKTDVALGRQTLPLVYAASQPPPGSAARILSRMDEGACLTWAVAATYRRHALDLIPRLTGDPTGRADLEALVRL